MATAVGTYATPANVKTRLNITAATNDAILTTICNQVNQFVETKTGRVLAPIASAVYQFDGSDSVEGQRCLLIPAGVRAITLLEIAAYTGGAFATIPASDYFLRPTAYERDPGWPATEVWMTDVPSASNTYPYFPDGFANVRITMTAGWPAQPDDIVELAEALVVRRFQARQSGQTDQVGTDAFGMQTISRLLSTDDWHLLQKYTIKAVNIV